MEDIKTWFHRVCLYTLADFLTCLYTEESGSAKRQYTCTKNIFWALKFKFLMYCKSFNLTRFKDF